MKQTNPIGALVKGVLWGTVTLAGGWIAYSRFGIDHHVPLPPAIDADVQRFVGQNSRFLTFYSDTSGTGRPLVLIHSINAAASAFEMRPLFEHYRGQRPVYALDLPGFGLSERADRVYSPELYKNAILDFMRQQVGQPADVITLSLGCEYVALAAVEQPDLFTSLAFIAPSGMANPSTMPRSQRSSAQGGNDTLFQIFTFPLWSRAIFDLLTTRPIIRWFLNLSTHGDPPEALVDYDYRTTHQPGAHYAPFYFVSGKLFTADIFDCAYIKIDLPVLVIYDQDPFVRYDRLPDLLMNKPNWKAARIVPSRSLVHWERLPDVTEAIDSFWREHAAAGATS